VFSAESVADFACTVEWNLTIKNEELETGEEKMVFAEFKITGSKLGSMCGD
jgi:hypothetical protein